MQLNNHVIKIWEENYKNIEKWKEMKVMFHNLMLYLF